MSPGQGGRVDWLCEVLLNLGFRVEVQEFTGEPFRPNAGRSGRLTAPAYLERLFALKRFPVSVTDL